MTLILAFKTHRTFSISFPSINFCSLAALVIDHYLRQVLTLDFASNAQMFFVNFARIKCQVVSHQPCTLPIE